MNRLRLLNGWCGRKNNSRVDVNFKRQRECINTLGLPLKNLKARNRVRFATAINCRSCDCGRSFPSSGKVINTRFDKHFPPLCIYASIIYNLHFTPNVQTAVLAMNCDNVRHDKKYAHISNHRFALFTSTTTERNLISYARLNVCWIKCLIMRRERIQLIFKTLLLSFALGKHQNVASRNL